MVRNKLCLRGASRLENVSFIRYTKVRTFTLKFASILLFETYDSLIVELHHETKGNLCINQCYNMRAQRIQHTNMPTPTNVYVSYIEYKDSNEHHRLTAKICEPSILCLEVIYILEDIGNSSKHQV
jgi:hypothetical protein